MSSLVIVMRLGREVATIVREHSVSGNGERFVLATALVNAVTLVKNLEVNSNEPCVSRGKIPNGAARPPLPRLPCSARLSRPAGVAQGFVRGLRPSRAPPAPAFTLPDLSGLAGELGPPFGG